MDSESQVTMNIMTFMATELKKSPRQACVREQGVGGGEHAGDIHVSFPVKQAFQK